MKKLLMAAVSLAGAFCALAAADTKTDSFKAHFAERATGAIKIDGVFDEADWKTAEPILDWGPTTFLRRTPAATVMRGPLVLAKGRAVGTSRAETLEFNTINRQGGWKLSLAEMKRTASNAGTWGAWNLTLEKDVPEKGVEKKTVPVADYWSVSCVDDPENWFSLWF